MIPIIAKIVKIATPIVRGAFKNGIPMGTGIVEAIKNIRNKNTAKQDDGSPVVSKPHDWKSIVSGLIVGGVMIYLFMTGKLTKEAMMDILSAFFVQGN